MKNLRLNESLTLLLAAAGLATCAAAPGQTPQSPPAGVAPATTLPDLPPPPPTQDSGQSQAPGVLSDIGAYFTAPLRWDGRDWAWFSGAMLGIAIAHRYDTQVRTHFVGPGPAPPTNSEDSKDAIPTAVVLGGTWAFALVTQDRAGYAEGWAMVEAAALSGVTSYGLKYAIGRETPEQTSDPNAWFKGGASFPSTHATVAFAVGTVLAESGNDDYRWPRRILGYGLGIFTSYERLKHNAHWLSDTAAGAALGIPSALFVMDRRYGTIGQARLALVPIPGGAMVTYRVSMQ
jgi:undecaprenyl-diphosphatase